MLECIPADTDRQTWLNVAMAVHEFDYISNEKLGYSKFLEWSKTGGYPPSYLLSYPHCYQHW
jgi:hypothetical protein